MNTRCVLPHNNNIKLNEIETLPAEHNFSVILVAIDNNSVRHDCSNPLRLDRKGHGGVIAYDENNIFVSIATT